jgi:Zn ribbon nucleic-acid-binding protein
VANVACDCCGALAWTYLFTESGIDLGRCAECGLHYVAQMPDRNERITQMEEGKHFAGGQTICGSDLHLEGEQIQQQRFQSLVDTARRFAP